MGHREAGECQRYREGALELNINTDQSRRQREAVVVCTQVRIHYYCKEAGDGRFPRKWISGFRKTDEDPFQVHDDDDNLER